MTSGQFQPPVWHTLDLKTTQIWWLTNMECKHSKLLLWCCCHLNFWPYKCTSLIIFGQVVCPNILKCQLPIYIFLILAPPAQSCPIQSLKCLLLEFYIHLCYDIDWKQFDNSFELVEPKLQYRVGDITKHVTLNAIDSISSVATLASSP